MTVDTGLKAQNKVGDKEFRTSEVSGVKLFCRSVADNVQPKERRHCYCPPSIAA